MLVSVRDLLAVGSSTQFGSEFQLPCSPNSLVQGLASIHKRVPLSILVMRSLVVMPSLPRRSVNLLLGGRRCLALAAENDLDQILEQSLRHCGSMVQEFPAFGRGPKSRLDADRCSSRPILVNPDPIPIRNLVL